MDLEQSFTALLSKSEQLEQENELLKLMLSVVKENRDLQHNHSESQFSRVSKYAKHIQATIYERVLRVWCERTVSTPSGRHPSSLWQNTINERQFRQDLQQTRVKHEQRTSSLVDLKSFIQNSVHTDTSEEAEFQSSRADFPCKVKGPERLLGEIAYQLDRRILSHIFQGQKRLYGFTLLNIPHKIIEVSSHPLTGKVDDGYRLHLTQRYADLMERLNQLGYKPTLHPPFTEFIVNTYGILKERPCENSPQATEYNNPDFLRNFIVTTAPRKLQRDLLLVLTCLCNMAEQHRKPLLMW
ncbi:speriolin-like [Plectropomus leopardus]|uniref:speriolin-like n=1 Tax=Plectropomus leopardus TaxID=160734 RepID=UPI001C4B302D|nr:speriolin-like [Plectropomus leopardus]